MLCLQGLEDQLLALVVNKERPDLEETKTQLIIQNTEFTIKLKQLEDELLYKLSTAEGDITGGTHLVVQYFSKYAKFMSSLSVHLHAINFMHWILYMLQGGNRDSAVVLAKHRRCSEAHGTGSQYNNMHVLLPDNSCMQSLLPAAHLQRMLH
jgi:hypothetical protein